MLYISPLAEADFKKIHVQEKKVKNIGMLQFYAPLKHKERIIVYLSLYKVEIKYHSATIFPSLMTH